MTLRWARNPSTGRLAEDESAELFRALVEVTPGGRAQGMLMQIVAETKSWKYVEAVVVHVAQLLALYLVDHDDDTGTAVAQRQFGRFLTTYHRLKKERSR